MTTDTRTELQDFRIFLERQLASEGPPPSLDECLDLWRERREALAAVRQGLAEAESGLCRPYREVIDELRARTSAAKASLIIESFWLRRPIAMSLKS